MAKMIILRGVSGSGKSTWAEQQNALVVSRDKIRVMLFGPEADTAEYYKADTQVKKDILAQRERKVTVIHDGMIESALRAGVDVIVDNTNIEWKYVKATAKIGNRFGAEIEVKTFDVPLQRAVNNNVWRAANGGRNVPREVIVKQHSRLQGTLNNTLVEPYTPKPYFGTPGKPKAFLVDIDGTLAHMNGRSPYDWKRVGEDTVDEVIANIAASLSDDYTTIVMSGRDGSCAEETEAWLDKHGIWYDYLFMREAGDMRPDNIIKAELFDKYVRDNFDVKFVLDDRQQVVDMWRAMGIKCLQVEPGDF